MTEGKQDGHRKRKWLWLALAALVLVLAVLIVPPFLSVSRYKARITQLISASLGRPVRLSSVEARLLPRPGFVLTDLTVEEDPAYGAEPVFHATTVKASIRLLSLWRGRLELDTISADEASLNLVRTPSGHWNLDPLLRTATAHGKPETGGAVLGNPIKLPYLEASNSRINVKNGVEKLPFSLIGADISFWQQSPGEWRVRLRGQPARTDLALDQADTGIVRLEATMRQAPQLRQMPVRLDVEWSEAQLGQLTRLVLGADAGWRGDLTGQLHLEGTAEAALISSRLRAIGVHRAEFAPAAPMDFDANCALVAHFSARAIDNLVCDSPLGNGRIRLAGDLPGNGAQPRFSVALDRIPVAAALDALRTVRSDLGPGLNVAGLVSGKIDYATPTEPQQDQPAPKKPAQHGRSTKPRPPPPGPLTGNFSVEDFQISGTGLSRPIQIPKLLIEPAPSSAAPPQGENSSSSAAQSQALSATVAIPAGGPQPLTVSTRLTFSGYQIKVRGPASIAQAKELATVAGIGNVAGLDSLAGDPLSIDLTAEGPWMPAQRLPFGGVAPVAVLGAPQQPIPPADTLSGTVTVRNANWKADYLANHVEISQATLHIGPTELRWDPVVFTYGPVKGTATLSLPTPCNPPQPCQPKFQVNFGALDAAVLQTAFLGAREPGTLLSTLIARLRPASPPAWPELEGSLSAQSLILGPVTFLNPTASLRTSVNGAEITAFNAGLLGGRVEGSGTLHNAGTVHDKPSYTLQGKFEKLSPPALGQVLGLRWSGGVFDGSGKVDLIGYTGDDLATSAKGDFHFEWQHGSVSPSAGSGPIPPILSRFDRWTADAEIDNGTLTLKQNAVKRATAEVPVQAAIALADPPKVTFTTQRTAPPKH
jgi:hypothetical protein